MISDITIDTNVFIFASCDLGCCELLLKVFKSGINVCVDTNYEIMGEYGKNIVKMEGIAKKLIGDLLSGRSRNIKFITKKIYNKHYDLLLCSGFDVSDIKYVNVAFHSNSKLLVSNESDFCTGNNGRQSEEYVNNIRDIFSNCLSLKVMNGSDAIDYIRCKKT